MLKCRFRFSYKKNECQPNNLLYVIMACIALHNIRISENYPCHTQWLLQVDELDRTSIFFISQKNKEHSNLNQMKIYSQLWMDHYCQTVLKRHTLLYIDVLKLFMASVRMNTNNYLLQYNLEASAACFAACFAFFVKIVKTILSHKI